jgi:hypothetical protein
MDDIDLPVFTFRPNWREGVVERVSFLTDVLRGALGTEQRRTLRLVPRRTAEADFLLKGPERTFWDLFINKLGGTEVMVPLYWDMATLTQPVPFVEPPADDDPPIEVSLYWENGVGGNLAHEFQIGELAVLMGKTALEYEVVAIRNIDPYGATIYQTKRAWPLGTKIMPLRRALIDDMGTPNHYSAGVAAVSMRFLYTTPMSHVPAADASPVYLGRPVFLDEPNWVDNLDVSFDRDTLRLDNDLGLPYQVDPTGRVTLGQSHRWFLPGRQRLAAFRDLIYRHRGRAGSFWLPTFKADLQLVNSPGSGATQLVVENVGYGYTGGPTDGREYIAIKHSTGTLFRRVTSVVPGTTAATEKVNLDAPLGLALSPGLVRRISFMDVARFDQDDFEITHQGGIDAYHECQAVFRTFDGGRTAPLPISFPIPTANKNTLACGQTGLAWQMPCNPGSSGGTCACVNYAESQYRVKGDPGTTYNVVFRVRGVVEQLPVTGGTPVAGSSGRCLKAPYTLPGGGYQPYTLQVSDPPATYVFNHNPSTAAIVVLDYSVTIPVKGGALLKMIATASDGQQLRPSGQQAPDNDPNYPIVVYQPFDGQFMQLDGALPGEDE